MSTLPAEVTTTIEGASIIERPRDPETGPNVLFIPCGCGGFRYSHDTATTWVRETFPNLDAAQVERAVRYVGSHVRARLLEAARAQAANGRSSWTGWRPLDRMMADE